MIATTLVALALSAAVSAGPALSLTLSGGANFRGINAAVVSATLTNTGDAEARVLNDPTTVLSKMETDTFAILSSNGATPKFTGKLVKWVPSPADVTVLQPGESVTVEHALGDAYDFSKSGAGAYSIETSSHFTLVTAAGYETIYADTTAHEAHLQGELVRPRPAEQKRATYKGCSATRQSQLATAQSGAQTYAANAYNYARNVTSGTARYTTWFGTYTASRAATVTSHFQKISAGSYASYTYDCTCTDSAYAYTYKANTGQVWLCNAFWSAPATGTDSKAGTLVHESSHWNAYAGTNDNAYGQSAAKSLAKSNPTAAVANADSHEYFAENTPAQS